MLFLPVWFGEMFSWPFSTSASFRKGRGKKDTVIVYSMCTGVKSKCLCLNYDKTTAEIVLACLILHLSFDGKVEDKPWRRRESPDHRQEQTHDDFVGCQGCQTCLCSSSQRHLLPILARLCFQCLWFSPLHAEQFQVSSFCTSYIMCLLNSNSVLWWKQAKSWLSQEDTMSIVVLIGYSLRLTYWMLSYGASDISAA